MAGPRSTKRRHRSTGGLALLGVIAPLLLAGAADAEEIRTVVVGLQARRNVDEGLALAMSDVVQGEMLADRTRTVFGRTDLQRVLEFESERQALGCVDDSCLAEIASALDVDRIITGSMDKVGSSYFVVITEIDAQKVEPLGRVQKRLPLNEDQLITGIQEMTRELLRITASGGSGAVSAAVIDKGGSSPSGGDQPPGTASAGDSHAAAAAAAAGVVVVTTDPPGREVFLGNKVVGQTPLRLEDVPVGTAELRVRLDDGDPVFVDVPVTPGAATEVNAKIGVMASDAEYDAYDDAVSSWETWLYLKLGAAAAAAACGTPVCAIGGFVAGALIGLYVAPAMTTFLGYAGCALLGLPVCGSGIALAGWGLYDYMNEPEAPVALDGPVHRVEVLPPDSEPIRFDVEAEKAEDAVEEHVAPKRKAKSGQADAPEAYRDEESRRDDDENARRDEHDRAYDDEDDRGYDEEEEEEQGFRPRAQRLPTGPRLAGDSFRY